MARRPGFTSQKDVTLLGPAVPKAEAPETPQVCHSISHAVVNPFTARVLDGVLKGDCNFCVCGRNPMI